MYPSERGRGLCALSVQMKRGVVSAPSQSKGKGAWSRCLVCPSERGRGLCNLNQRERGHGLCAMSVQVRGGVVFTPDQFYVKGGVASVTL